MRQANEIMRNIQFNRELTVGTSAERTKEKTVVEVLREDVTRRPSNRCA